MNRFLHAFGKRFYWVAGLLLAAYLIPLESIVRWLGDQLVGSEAGQSTFQKVAAYFAGHPGMIVPTFIGVGIVLIFLISVKESHFSGKPLLKVTGITMKGMAMVRPQDGGSHIVGSVYVPFENVSNGTGPEATVTNLTARVMLRGKMMRGSLEFRVPLCREDQREEQPKINLEPAEKARINLVIGHPLKSDTMVPATLDNLVPHSTKGIGYAILYHFSDPVYLARVRFRGIGVNQVMWFCIWNWGHVNEYPNSIYGPMSLWKRTKLRLHLLGLVKQWHPYRPYKPDENAPKFEWKPPDLKDKAQ